MELSILQCELFCLIDTINVEIFFHEDFKFSAHQFVGKFFKLIGAVVENVLVIDENDFGLKNVNYQRSH